MKTKLTILLLVTTAVLANDPGWIEPPQPSKEQTFNREVVVEGKQYRVEYKWDDGGAWVPSTMTGQPHYPARITVYLDGKAIHQNPILGTYVPGGCFEDVPADWVKKALAAKDEPLKPEPHLFIGGVGIYTNDMVFSNLYHELVTTNLFVPTNLWSVSRGNLDKIMKVVDDALAKAREEILKELEK